MKIAFITKKGDGFKMRKKVEENKLQKRNALFQSSFDLFLNHGFGKTTISDIVKKAGLAKGTFYLYFKDKYDLRDKLITHITGQLFEDAHQEMIEHPKDDDFESTVIRVCDYFVKRFEDDPKLLRFISKNLSWGIFKNALSTDVPDEDIPFFRYYNEQIKQFSVRCEQPELMLFTIIELVGSVSYSCILYKQPITMQEYLPYLHRSIRAILKAYTVTEHDGNLRFITNEVEG